MQRKLCGTPRYLDESHPSIVLGCAVLVYTRLLPTRPCPGVRMALLIRKAHQLSKGAQFPHAALV